MLNPHRHLQKCRLEACLGLGPFALGTVIKTVIRGSFWSLTFVREGVEVKKKHPRDIWIKSINESSLNFMKFTLCSPGKLHCEFERADS